VTLILLACVLQAQEPFQDPLGVTVDLNGATLMHRGPVLYPIDARVANIQGSVTAQVRLDGKGKVVDASILSGPDELRATVLQSVLTWHFTSDSANGTRQVTVTFTIPKGNRTFRFATPASTAPPGEIGSISVPGGPEALGRLPVHVGDTLTPELRDSLIKTVHEYDEHYTVMIGTNSLTGKLSISIREPGTQSFPRPVTGVVGGVPGGVPGGIAGGVPGGIAGGAGSVTVTAGAQEANLINKVTPEYPALAKAARVQGTVKFEAVIGKDGTVQNLQLISGPPLLIQAAMQAVRQWTYKPTLLNGQPVEVVTTLEVNFSLSQ